MEKDSIDNPPGLTILNRVDWLSLTIDVIDQAPRLQMSGAMEASHDC